MRDFPAGERCRSGWNHRGSAEPAGSPAFHGPIQACTGAGGRCGTKALWKRGAVRMERAACAAGGRGIVPRHCVPNTVRRGSGEKQAVGHDFESARPAEQAPVALRLNPRPRVESGHPHRCPMFQDLERTPRIPQSVSSSLPRTGFQPWISSCSAVGLGPPSGRPVNAAWLMWAERKQALRKRRASRRISSSRSNAGANGTSRSSGAPAHRGQWGRRCGGARRRRAEASRNGICLGPAPNQGTLESARKASPF